MESEYVFVEANLESSIINLNSNKIINNTNYLTEYYNLTNYNYYDILSVCYESIINNSKPVLNEIYDIFELLNQIIKLQNEYNQYHSFYY